MTENLGCVVEHFLAHKRTLDRKYLSEEAELRLLVRFAEQHHVDRLDQLTAALLDDFLASRPRSRPRSFNHLLGVVRGLLDWAVTYELLQSLAAAHPATPRHHCAHPVRVRRRGGPSPARGRRRRCRTTREPGSGAPTYRTIFALCYGLGLRAGEVCGLRLGDVDHERDLLVVRGGKFGKTRLVPHGPRIGELIAEQLARRRADGAVGDDAPLFSFDGRRLRASRHRQPGVPSPGDHTRTRCPRGCFAASATRSQTLVRGRMSAALVSRRAGPIDPAAASGDLPGSRRPRLHGGLPHDHARDCWPRPTGDSKPSPNRPGGRLRDDLHPRRWANCCSRSSSTT